ncbi:MAG: hypothetical protein CML42_10275 [Rhodobacteraceae bacterium]|nr:hypothetical protein [Paracoccaceae bacterium]
MAITQTTYTGNGSTTNYSFTFEYLKQADVKVTLNTVATTAFTFANATTLAFTTAPGNGVAIRIFRDTTIDTLSSTFFSGSAIKAEDLNNNFTQNLYVTQESSNEAETATTTANSAVTTANTANTTAGTANTTAGTAVTTANSAVTTANSAVTTANSAVTTANAASSAATTATNTANSASSVANSAAAAVSQAVIFTLIANVAAIPGSPSNNDYIEIGDSTGIQSLSGLSGLPSGFIGASGLTVRLRYDSSASNWVFMNYFANDSETRYLTKNIPVVTGDATNGSGQITLNCENNDHGVKIKGPPHSAAANYTLTLPNDDGTSNQVLSTNGSGVLSWVNQTDISGKANLAGPTFTGVPAAPTASSSTNTTQIATTAFVVTAISGKANLAGPTFTGTPAAPTASAGTNTTQLATTAFVTAAIDPDTAKTDVAQTYTAAQRGTITTLTDGATVTPDFAVSNNYVLTLGGNRTIANPTNLTAGQSGSIFLVQDGTGSRTAAWGSYWDFAGGTAPTLTTTAAAVDRVDYVVRTTGSIHAVATLAYS